MKKNKSFKKLKDITVAVISPSSIGVVLYLVIFAITVIDNASTPYKRAALNLKTSDFQGTFLFRVFTDIGSFTRLQIVSDIIVYVFWIIVGTVIYLIARRVVTNEHDVIENISMRHYIWPKGSDVNKPLRQFFERLLFHTALAVVILIYTIKGLPLLHSWWQNHHQNLMFTARSIEVNLLLLLYEVLFLHGLVILLRLFFVRRRLFSSK